MPCDLSVPKDFSRFINLKGNLLLFRNHWCGSVYHHGHLHDLLGGGLVRNDFLNGESFSNISCQL